ncbi:MAG: hypothetical protein ABJ360_11655 [Roseobacter sp.]|uniref:hypothetical protein n=1 Tax=Tateyamaria sp. TaxID=1929288 RepID=UPI003284EF7D
MRLQVLATSSLMVITSCSMEPENEQPSVHLLTDFEKSRAPDNSHTHRLYTEVREDREKGLPADALAIISKTCKSPKTLSEAEVDLQYTGWQHTDFIDGTFADQDTYTFRCPEPGKEIQ